MGMGAREGCNEKASYSAVVCTLLFGFLAAHKHNRKTPEYSPRQNRLLSHYTPPEHHSPSKIKCNRSPQCRASTALASLVQQVPGPRTLLHEIEIDGYWSSQPHRSGQPPNLLALVLRRCPPPKT